jgi:hypothetical protein
MFGRDDGGGNGDGDTVANDDSKGFREPDYMRMN